MTPTSPPPGPRQTEQPIHESRTSRDSEEKENQSLEHGEGQDGGEKRQVRKVWEAQRAALAEAFPAWKIVCVSHLAVPLWFALYRHPLTPQQEQAGFRPTMLRGSAEALQAELALRCRITRLPLPPPTP